MANPAGRAALPDQIAEAVLTGNLHYPQTTVGMAVYGSRTTVDMIVSGEAAWREIVMAVPTDEQRARTYRAVQVAHKAFDIRYRHEDDPAATELTFTTERLDLITMSFTAQFTRAAADYAANLLPGVQPVPPKVPVFMNERNTPNLAEMLRIEADAMDVLFGGRMRLKPENVRPEAIALQGMLAAIHDALQPNTNPYARELSKERLPHVRLRHITGKHSHAHHEAAEAQELLNRQMAHFATTALVNTLSDIYNRTGVFVPVAVTERFLKIFVGGPVYENDGDAA